MQLKWQERERKGEVMSQPGQEQMREDGEEGRGKWQENRTLDTEMRVQVIKSGEGF